MLALFAGVKQSAKMNMAIVLVKVTALIVFITVAAFHINPVLWTPFMPYGWFGYTENGQTVGVLAAASLVFFAYRGFQNVSFAVEEARRPQRDVPIDRRRRRSTPRHGCRCGRGAGRRASTDSPARIWARGRRIAQGR